MGGKVLKTNLKGTGTFEIFVVGESNYQDDIHTLLRNPPIQRGADVKFGRPATFFTATLQSEPDNPFDRNAIAVMIENRKVGYLDSIMASKIREQLESLGFEKIIAVCKAVVLGKTSDGFTREVCEVRLDIQRKSQTSDGSNEGRQMSFGFWVGCIGADYAPVVDSDVGKRVKLWTREGKGSEIRVYCDDIGENRMIGYVPEKYVYSIRQRVLVNLDYDASITAIRPNERMIECHFVPKEETARMQAEALESCRVNLVEQLSKPYRPRKPIVFTTFASRDAATQGDTLMLDGMPTINELLLPFSATLRFVCQRTGAIVEKSNDNELVKKIIRINLENKRLKFCVVSKNASKQQEVEYRIELMLV